LILGCRGAAPARGAGDTRSEADASAAPERDARAFVDRLAHRDWAGATARFDPKMKEGLPPEKLEANWARIEDEAGAWLSVELSAWR
ncbi:MAG TPA: DUF3887 domain-containing protein, partial [Polyangiaceae bacterium]|nr:DUF3887 domain-containing protein [Polyangiaceae bacterium]